MTSLRLEAPAKLNLTLSVVGRRSDGYHLLESSLVLLELADRLTLTSTGTGVEVTGDALGEVPLDDRNLAWRGLRAATGAEPGPGSIRLEKRIPVAAGLGGGSSDAAAAWRLGRSRRGLADEASASDLAELAGIGADVPFFAARVAAARVTGIGERVEPLPPVDSHVVLAHPEFGLSTAAIFAELRPSEWGSLENDLLAPARRLRPDLDDLFAEVTRAGGTPRLTGSGSTVFSLASDPDEAASVAGALSRAGIRATITRTRTRPTTIDLIEEDAT